MITFSSSHSRAHNIVIAMRKQIYKIINTLDISINAEDHINMPNLLFCRYCVTFIKGNTCISRKTYTVIYIVFKCTANYLSVPLSFFLTSAHYVCIANIFALVKILYNTFLRFEILFRKIYSPEYKLISEKR